MRSSQFSRACHSFFFFNFSPLLQSAESSLDHRLPHTSVPLGPSSDLLLLISFSTPEDSMVSALWKSCSEGDLESVHESLKEASVIDIEIKGTFRSSQLTGHSFGFTL